MATRRFAGYHPGIGSDIGFIGSVRLDDRREKFFEPDHEIGSDRIPVKCPFCFHLTVVALALAPLHLTKLV